MSRRLEGLTAFVTAAAQGIGRATALRLADEGAHVLAADVDGARLSGLDGHAGIETLAIDATDAAAVTQALARPARLDILVNAVGRVHDGTILQCDEDEWARSFRTNVDSTYRCIVAALPRMIEGGGGSIVNVASIASSVKAAPSRAAYSATKAAMIGITKSVAIDYVTKGIRCNAVCPGMVDTPSLGERINAYPDPVAARAAFVARQPMGRLGTADEVAALCCYLASSESAFMTGQVVVLDGGITA